MRPVDEADAEAPSGIPPQWGWSSMLLLGRHCKELYIYLQVCSTSGRQDMCRTSLIHTSCGFTHWHSTSHFPRSLCFLTDIYLTRLTQVLAMKEVFPVAMPHTASCWSLQGGRWRARTWETSPSSPWGMPELSKWTLGEKEGGNTQTVLDKAYSVLQGLGKCLICMEGFREVLIMQHCLEQQWQVEKTAFEYNIQNQDKVTAHVGPWFSFMCYTSFLILLLFDLKNS